MSEKKEPIKVSLKIVLLIVILLVLIIVGMVWYIKNNSASVQIPQTNEVAENLVKEEKTEEENEKEKTATDLNTDFLRFNNNKENMIYSPLSIKYALSMLNEGADNNTRKQIESVLGDIELTKYENIENILSVANGLFIRDSYEEKINSEYVDNLKGNYDAEVKIDAFKNANNVNEWIEEKTFGILEDIVRDEIVQNPNLQMILTNALAIDMEWEAKFDPKDTYGGDFTLEDGITVNATMMRRTSTEDDVKYFKDETLTAISMDLKEYNDVELEFVGVMPNDKTLEEYIKNFTTEEFNNLLDEMDGASNTKKGVNINIPKFEFDYELSLKEDLQRLGIADAFNQAMADFSKISDTGLYVGDVLHKADIEFSEEGVKAAAVTVIMMLDGMVMADEERPIDIIFDNPFAYVIRDKNSGEIWFVGTVYEPNSWEEDREDYQYR